MGSPVFNDATGTRVSAILWGSRVFLAVAVLLAVALVLTLRSHVSIPGLERLGPVLDEQRIRPVVRPGPSNPPTEQAEVATELSSFRAEPSARPTTGRVDPSPADAAGPARARRAGDPAVTQTVEPSSAPTAARASAPPTGSVSPTAANPTARAIGQGTEKPRNPRAATPSPGNEQAPGQTRRPKPKPTADLD